VFSNENKFESQNLSPEFPVTRMTKKSQLEDVALFAQASNASFAILKKLN
jgi:hypothetical protein